MNYKRKGLTPEYQNLLKNKRWLLFREKILARDGSKCQICGATEHLVVHHKQYHFDKRRDKKCNPWDYEPIYLVTLCRSCHEKGHNLYEIPMKYINQKNKKR